MTPVLAVLLLAAAQAENPAGSAPVPVPQSTATQPPAASPLPEATDTQQAKPAAPRQQLRILPQDNRMEAYQEFRNLYELARFDEALPYAKRVVELSEADADRDYQLPIAYNNLGATQYQLADYASAEVSYRKSLELLESTQGISSRRLVVPIAGLGAVYAAKDEHAIAAELFDRALAVSRRADGLFNLQQLPLLEQAADSRYAISDFGGAEREHLYALKVAEQNFGFGDPRTLPALLELGSFYEGLREFIAARNMYMRARDVALKPGVYDPHAVRALCGIARSHRLQYTMDPDTLESQQPARDEVTGEMIGKVYKESRVPPPAADRTGLKAVQTALDLLRSTASPPPELMTETLIELGDWFQATSRPTLAMPYYAEAAAIFDAQTAADPLAGHPLKAPRMVFYRPPLSASRGLNTLSGQYVIRKTVFSFAVSETGVPMDINVVSSNMEEGQLSQSRRAVGKAIYSPRFAAGQPVSTAGVTFTSEWYQEYDPDSSPPDAKPVSTTPAEPAPEPEPKPEEKPASGSGT
ncbi:MAG TPA: tetratricopeptide repeat protein [Steroidobacteraceae bacterium]|nr:tetratricopeptide repeat protein [Steroidobacteraceae bacterium]